MVAPPNSRPIRLSVEQEDILLVRSSALEAIEQRIRSKTPETLERARAGHLVPRQAPSQMTRVRIEEAMGYREH